MFNLKFSGGFNRKEKQIEVILAHGRTVWAGFFGIHRIKVIKL